MDYIVLLPDNVLCHIFKLLEGPDLASCEMACQLFSFIIHSNVIWRHKCLTEIRDKDILIELTGIKNISKYMNHTYGGKREERSYEGKKSIRPPHLRNTNYIPFAPSYQSTPVPSLKLKSDGVGNWRGDNNRRRQSFRDFTSDRDKSKLLNKTNWWFNNGAFWKGTYVTWYIVIKFTQQDPYRCSQGAYTETSTFKVSSHSFEQTVESKGQKNLWMANRRYSCPQVKFVKNSGNTVNGLNITSSKSIFGQYLITGHSQGEISVWEIFHNPDSRNYSNFVAKIDADSVRYVRYQKRYQLLNKDSFELPPDHLLCGNHVKVRHKPSLLLVNWKKNFKRFYKSFISSPSDEEQILYISEPMFRIKRHSNAVTDLALLQLKMQLPTEPGNEGVLESIHEILAISYDNSVSLMSFSRHGKPKNDRNPVKLGKTLFQGKSKIYEKFGNNDNLITGGIENRLTGNNGVFSQKVTGFLTNHSPETMSVWKNIVATDGPNNSIYVWRLMKSKDPGGQNTEAKKSLKCNKETVITQTIHASLMKRGRHGKLKFRSLRNYLNGRNTAENNVESSNLCRPHCKSFPKLKFLFSLSGHPKRILYIRIWDHLITSFSLQGDARLWCLETGRCLRIVNFGIPFDDAIFYFHLPPYTRLKNFAARGQLFLYLKEGNLLVSYEGLIYTKPLLLGMPFDSCDPIAISLCANVLLIGAQSQDQFKLYLTHLTIDRAYQTAVTPRKRNTNYNGTRLNDVYDGCAFNKSWNRRESKEINRQNKLINALSNESISLKPESCVYTYKIQSPADHIQYLDLTVSRDDGRSSKTYKNYRYNLCDGYATNYMPNVSNHVVVVTTRRKLHYIKLRNDFFYPVSVRTGCKSPVSFGFTDLKRAIKQRSGKLEMGSLLTKPFNHFSGSYVINPISLEDD